MYDSVTVADLPADGDLYAAYETGRYRNIDKVRERFPNRLVVGICTQARYNLGTVLDVEPGDATAQEAPPWVQRRRDAGIVPTVYTYWANWPAVRQAFWAVGEPEPFYWIARYDNKPVLGAGMVAKQFANASQTGGHYDMSVVANYWPGVDEEPMTEQDFQRIQDMVNEHNAHMNEMEVRLVGRLQAIEDKLGIHPNA
jgi:hypothetical protein